jgi:hypothetical protein
MYTVMRIAGGTGQDDVVRGIVEEIARARPDVSPEQRRRDGVIVCDIARNPSWQDHELAIVRFLKDCSVSIAQAEARGMGISLDVAIDSEDLAPFPYLCIHCGTGFMKTLVEHGIELEFTVYGGQEADTTE